MDNLGVNTQTTTSSYASVLKVTMPVGKKSYDLGAVQVQKVLIHMIEKNVNAIKVKILASNDDTTYETIMAETTIAKNASLYETLSDPWMYIDVQAVDAVAETHGSLKVVISGS